MSSLHEQLQILFAACVIVLVLWLAAQLVQDVAGGLMRILG